MVFMNAADHVIKNEHLQDSFPTKVLDREWAALLTDLDKVRTVLNGKFTVKYIMLKYFLDVPIMKSSGRLEGGRLFNADVLLT